MKNKMEKRILSYDGASVQSIMVMLSGIIKVIDEDLIPTCLNVGIKPTTELLKGFFYDGLSVIDKAYREIIESDYVKLGIASKAVKETMLKDVEPVLKRFEAVRSKLNSYVSSNTHHLFMTYHISGFYLPGIFEIKDNKSFISLIGMEQIKSFFTVSIETKSQQEAYDLLQKMAKDMNALDVLFQKKNINPVNYDRDCFTTDADGKVIVNLEILKYL
jgi:hypothetical protein